MSVVAGCGTDPSGPSDDVLSELSDQASDIADQAVQFLSDTLDGINTLGQQLGAGSADLLGNDT